MNTKINNISVVIPLFNKEKYIKRAITSVRSQTYQCFELIVVNDGSTDNGLAKVKETEDKRIRIINQNNLGESAARNKGIAEAKYELIAFLDADDQWEPEFLENLACIAYKYPYAGLIGSGYKVTNTKGEMKYPNFEFVPAQEGIIHNYFKALIGDPPFCASSVAVKKTVFKELGGFTLGMRYGADTFMWSKIALNYQVAYINKVLAVVYRDAENRVSTKYEMADDYPLFDYVKSFDKLIDTEDYYYMKEYVYKRYLSLARRCLRVGDKGKARVFLSKAKPTKIYKHKYFRHKLALYLSYRIVNYVYSLWSKIAGEKR